MRIRHGSRRERNRSRASPGLETGPVDLRGRCFKQVFSDYSDKLAFRSALKRFSYLVASETAQAEFQG
jgi:hypothetical protein